MLIRLQGELPMPDDLTGQPRTDPFWPAVTLLADHACLSTRDMCLRWSNVVVNAITVAMTGAVAAILFFGLIVPVIMGPVTLLSRD